MAAARNAVVALSVRSLRACSAGPLDSVTPLGKGTPLPARRALPANRQRTLKAYECIQQPTSTARPVFIFAAVQLLLVACASAPEPDTSFEPPDYVARLPTTVDNGSIYQANAGIQLFADLRAARIGDILTVRLVERTIASKSSSTSTSKTTEASLTNPTIFGRPITRNGDAVFGGSLDGETTFDGSGSSNQSNSLNGDITVTVVERYPNGNLLIRGEKWVTINQGREFIRLSGIVRPYDIEPDNSIMSGKIADAQITYGGKGVLAAANRMGLISRFFNSIFSPY